MCVLHAQIPLHPPATAARRSCISQHTRPQPKTKTEKSLHLQTLVSTRPLSLVFCFSPTPPPPPFCTNEEQHLKDGGMPTLLCKNMSYSPHSSFPEPKREKSLRSSEASQPTNRTNGKASTRPTNRRNLQVQTDPCSLSRDFCCCSCGGRLFFSSFFSFFFEKNNNNI